MANVIETKTKNVKEAATGSRGSISDAADYVMDQVKEVGSNALAARTFLDKKAGEASTAIGDGLKSAARTIRQNGPHDARLGQATLAVAQTFSNSANYLDGPGLKGTVNDISNVIGKNPVSAVMIGVGMGFLLGRTVAKN